MDNNFPDLSKRYTGALQIDVTITGSNDEREEKAAELSQFLREELGLQLVGVNRMIEERIIYQFVDEATNKRLQEDIVQSCRNSAGFLLNKETG